MWFLLACFQATELSPPAEKGPAGPPGSAPAGGGPASDAKSPPPPGEGPQPLPLSANPGNSKLTWTVGGETLESEGFRVETDAEGSTFRGAVHLDDGQKLEFEASDIEASGDGHVATVTFETQGEKHKLDVPLTLKVVEGGLDIGVHGPLEVDGASIQIDAELVFRVTE